MGKISTGLSISLDGFIAGANDGPERPLGEGGERLFAWYSSGDTEYSLPGTEMVFRVSPQSAELLRGAHSKIGAFVTGRRTFDITNGWGSRPPLGVPTFVATGWKDPGRRAPKPQALFSRTRTSPSHPDLHPRRWTRYKTRFCASITFLFVLRAAPYPAQGPRSVPDSSLRAQSSSRLASPATDREPRAPHPRRARRVPR